MGVQLELYGVSESFNRSFCIVFPMLDIISINFDFKKRGELSDSIVGG